MIDMKVWLERNFASRNYDDPDVDPDLVAGRHKGRGQRQVTAQAAAETAPRRSLNRGHAAELAVRKELADRKKLFS